MVDAKKTLLYFADPMCSWCWGFSPVVEKIRKDFGNLVPIELILGGLRPNETQALDKKLREEILHHWHAVHDRTGQPFLFDNALPDGFVYNTEPASRALVAMAEIQAESVLFLLKDIQSAFYAEQQDVTNDSVLLRLLDSYEVDHQQFKTLYQSDNIKTVTQSHFRRTYEYGVRGFPTLVFQNADELTLLSHGYQPYENLKQTIEAHVRT